MAFNDSKGKNKMFTEINITPLTDIFLVLLIIMMVVAPSFQSNDNDINVPEINSGVAIEQKNATVSVTKEGNFFINGNPINPDNLYQALTDLKPKLEKKEVVVKADSAVKNSEIMKIMRAAQESGYTKLIVAGEPLSKKDQKKLEKTAHAATEEQNIAQPQEQQTFPTEPIAQPTPEQTTTVSNNSDWEE